MGHIFQHIERGSFQNILPSTLWPKLPAFDQILSKNGKKQKVDGNDNNNESKRVMNDIMVVEECKLRKYEENRFRDIFNPKVLVDRPLYS